MVKKVSLFLLTAIFALGLIGCTKEVKSDVEVHGVVGSGSKNDPYVVEIYEDGVITKELSANLNVDLTGKNTIIKSEENIITFKGLKKGEEIHQVKDSKNKTFFVKTIVHEKGFNLTTKKSFKNSLKVLAIGNSFSEDATRYLYDIAHDFGVEEIVIGNLYIGGASLELHASNIKNSSSSYTYWLNKDGEWKNMGSQSIKIALLLEDWDVVTVQQSSPDSGKADTYQPYLDEVIDFVKENANNDVTIFWHQTWAYQKDSGHTSFPDYDRDQLKMYNSIVEATKEKIINNNKVYSFIPSGTTVQNMRETKIGDRLTSDGHHLNITGRFAAGLQWFRTITGFSIDDIKVLPTGINEEILELAKQSVNSAYNNPFIVTK
ncbi:DUF4886 domain-containing protein [Haploplasma axanthum]|uniref:DUF4886 domain-containing protein n=1 Tax=Haploplasma axanthum TaxID=29552 RepID=A0A449BFJ7_HAPAX|nr:DUF4886 domain-containing protein [Haploplasma axanthum]VEU81211.1 Uncharacterised protein [Haploplasma axanthum]